MAAFWNEVRTALIGFAWYEWLALGTGIVYVLLAARQQRSCWYWGIVSCLLWAYADVYYYLLYLDAILQLFYVGMGCGDSFSGMPLHPARVSGSNACPGRNI